MDQEKAYFIVHALANGLDPITGARFSDHSPYHHPDVIRALFYVLRNQSPQKKQKKSHEERQQENLQKGLPINYGLPWTDDCIEFVINEYQKHSTIDEIAEELGRKPNSIIGLLRKKEIITEDQAFAMGLRYQTRAH